MPAHSARAWAKKGRRRRDGQERWWLRLLWSGSGGACARWRVRREVRLARSRRAGSEWPRVCMLMLLVYGVRGVVEIAMRRGRWNAGRQASGSSGYGTNSQVSSLASHGVCEQEEADAGRQADAMLGHRLRRLRRHRERERHTHTHAAAGDRERRGTRCEAREGEAGWQRRVRASRCASPVFHHSSRTAREQLRTTIPACLIACYGVSHLILPSHPSSSPAPIGRVPPTRHHPRQYPGQSRMSAR